jgi:hypothetical protein
MTARTTRSELAIALPLVIAIMVVVLILGAAIAINTITGVRAGGATAGRTMSQQAIEDGVGLYRISLETNVATEATNWLPPPDLMQQVLRDRGTVVPLARLTGLPDAYRFPPRGGANWAVRMAPDGDGEHRFWQLLRVTGPGAGGSGSVTAWIRGWYGAPDGATARSVIVGRASFTPGGFHQFQLLVDGPIRFDEGATITGPVHSNGNGAGAEAAIAPLPGAHVGCAGEFARLSAAAGGVSSAMPSSCKRVTSARRWNFGTVRETFDSIGDATAAGGEGVMVADPGPGGSVAIRLQGAQVDVGGQLRDIGEGLAILALGDVMVSGTSSGRVTIASDPRGERAGQILIDGDVRASGAAGVVGLFTEGDVVVSSSPCVSRVEAAVIAARGGLTIDRGFRTDLAQLDAPNCPAFSYSGSIAAAESPVLRWTWPGGQAAGYGRRSYEWNPRLVRNPPPWTPVIEGWQVRDWQESNSSCGLAGSTAGCT